MTEDTHHEFENLKEDKNESIAGRDINFLLDIPVELTVQLGTTKMLIKEIMVKSVWKKVAKAVFL